MTQLFTAGEALAWSNAQPIGPLPEGFSGVSTDTRTLQPGHLFVALRGAHFDGHRFLAEARGRGAGAALVDQPVSSELPQLLVTNVLLGFGRLASGYRQTLSPVVVGITGSLGKTSTKELLAAALRPLGAVLQTAGNLNNEIGVPLTLFGLRPEHRAAAIEMGMNHAGEIARLAEMARPSIGLVLNARGVHLEQLGTIEAVARAKGELFFGLPPQGVAVANGDDRLVMEQASAAGRPMLTFGKESPAPLTVRLTAQSDGGLRGVHFDCVVTGRTLHGALSLLGAHNALNGCAALAAALAAGVEPEAALAAMAGARSAPHRLALQQLDQGVTLLDDCYNASPASMLSALETLRGAGRQRRLGAILGDMLELGPGELDLHRQVGEACKGLAWLLCVGRRAAAIAHGAAAAGVADIGAIEDGDDLDAGLQWVRSRLQPDDAVLLKASRGMRLERFAAGLGADSGGH